MKKGTLKKYPNGFKEKLEYHFSQMMQACKDENADGVRFSMAKLGYFAEREAQRLEALELILDEDDD